MSIISLARDFLEAVVVVKYILFRVCQNIPSECTGILPLRAIAITWKNVRVLWSFNWVYQEDIIDYVFWDL